MHAAPISTHPEERNEMPKKNWTHCITENNSNKSLSFICIYISVPTFPSHSHSFLFLLHPWLIVVKNQSDVPDVPDMPGVYHKTAQRQW